MTDPNQPLSPVPDGFVVVDKPLGWSSMDVVRQVRRLVAAELRAAGHEIRDKKVRCGHGGTLDPLATGVVVCGVGKATRRLEAVVAAEKIYAAEADLSAFTATDDAEAAAEREEVPVETPPTSAEIRHALDALTGDIDQRVPNFSAVKIDGKRAYRLARAGEDVDMPVKRVRVERIEVLGYDWPRLRLRVTSGKGVYIRAIARDLGQALGTGGHLTALRRERVGQFTLEGAVRFERDDGAVEADGVAGEAGVRRWRVAGGGGLPLMPME